MRKNFEPMIEVVSKKGIHYLILNQQGSVLEVMDEEGKYGTILTKIVKAIPAIPLEAKIKTKVLRRYIDKLNQYESGWYDDARAFAAPSECYDDISNIFCKKLHTAFKNLGLSLIHFNIIMEYFAKVENKYIDNSSADSCGGWEVCKVYDQMNYFFNHMNHMSNRIRRLNY